MATLAYCRDLLAVGAISWLASVLSGCCPEDANCEPAVSNERTNVETVSLPETWTGGAYRSFRIIVTTGPYRIDEFALDQLRSTMAEQAGLEVLVQEGTDTGLSGISKVDSAEIIAAGKAQIPDGNDAVLVIVVVQDSTAPDAAYGFIDHDTDSDGRPFAVLGLHRASIYRISFGPLKATDIEAGTVLHEVGHWLGVPARDFHTSANDAVHCTCARCVMFKGNRVGICAIRANLCTGYPLRFCQDCAEELAEARRRRDGVNGIPQRSATAPSPVRMPRYLSRGNRSYPTSLK